jgi:DNA-binding NarL/FixJ family response regulator
MSVKKRKGAGPAVKNGYNGQSREATFGLQDAGGKGREMTIRVVSADCHPLFRAGINTVVSTETEFIVVGEACDGEEAQTLCLELQPDVLLLDLSMPGLSAEETIRAVKSSCKNIKIIILTAYDNEGYVRTLLECDIHGYILKTETAEVIVEAILSVMQGGFFFSQSVQEKMAEVQDSAVHLTSRELEVLELVREGNSNLQIGDALNISDRTVRSHLENILQKMQANNRTEAVRMAIQQGWINN